MTDTTSSAAQRPRFTQGQQRLLDVVATAILVPQLSNAPLWLGRESQPFFLFPIPITVLVFSIVLAASLYRGDRRFLLPSFIPPVAMVVGHLRFLTQIPVNHSDEGWHLTPGRYLFEHSTQILIAVFCIATLLYVFTSSRREANVA